LLNKSSWQFGSLCAKFDSKSFSATPPVKSTRASAVRLYPRVS
jgi:hypothetical protein